MIPFERLGPKTAAQLRQMQRRAESTGVFDAAIEAYGAESFAEDLTDLFVAAFDDNETLSLGERIARRKTRQFASKFARRLAGLDS